MLRQGTCRPAANRCAPGRRPCGSHPRGGGGAAHNARRIASCRACRGCVIESDSLAPRRVRWRRGEHVGHRVVARDRPVLVRAPDHGVRFPIAPGLWFRRGMTASQAGLPRSRRSNRSGTIWCWRTIGPFAGQQDVSPRRETQVHHEFRIQRSSGCRDGQCDCPSHHDLAVVAQVRAG